jgi:hypothetical protein
MVGQCCMGGGQWRRLAHGGYGSWRVGGGWGADRSKSRLPAMRAARAGAPGANAYP